MKDNQLDTLLLAYKIPEKDLSGLRHRILTDLPLQKRFGFLDRISDWLGVPLTPAYMLGPGSGFVMIMILGIWLGMDVADTSLLLDPVFYETTDAFDSLGDIL